MTHSTIAKARIADFPDVATLFRSYAATLPVDLGHQGFENELAELPGRYAPPGGALLIARGGSGAPLGCIALRTLTEDAGEVKRLYVLATARGSGVGRGLVAAIIEEARGLGYRELKLDTLSNMREAISLYRSFGFRPIPPYGSHPYDGLVCLGMTL